MKKCFRCENEKPLNEFYKHPQMPDGHLNKCKECNKKDVRENRAKRREYYNAYDRLRSYSEERKSQKRIRESRPEVKEKIRKQKQKYKPDDRRKLANTAVGNAIRDGRLIKLPCWICGSMDNIEAHHPDYDSPLDVVWLCTEHHAQIHRDYTEELSRVIVETTVKGSRYDKKERI